MAPGYTELSKLSNLNSGVEAVWVSVSNRKGAYRVLPDGRCDIILRFDAHRRPISDLTIVLTGPTTRYYDVPLEPSMGFAGVRLRPGFFEKVLGFEPIKLRDGNLFGAAALARCPELTALCAPAPDQESLAQRLASFVRRRSADSDFEFAPHCQAIISAVHASGGRLRIQDLSDMHGIAERTVRRIILRAIGLPPKAFAGIIQFHRALRLLRDHQLSPVEAALEAGFADQSHMSRVFRRMGGFSPARLPDVTLVTISE
jgi:AraC-like DNA-binding protein